MYLEEKDVYREINLIRNYKYKIFSETIRKKARTAFDDKRYIMSDGINTLPEGFRVEVLIKKNGVGGFNGRPLHYL